MVLFLCFVGAGVGGMTKRGGASNVENKDPKKAKSGDEGASMISIPFGESTAVRNFKLIVEEKTLFVNPYCLADSSPYFYTLCFGPFAEGLKGEAVFKDTSYDDLLEMLQVMAMDPNTLPKEININNFISMLKLSEKWEVKGLRIRCIFFIESRFPSVPTNFATTVQVLMACEECRLPETVLCMVGSRLAAFGRSLLVDQQVSSNIQNAGLWLAVFAAAEASERSTLHEPDNYSATTKDCNFPACNLRPRSCVYCKNASCSLHDICIRRVDSFKTTINKQLDKSLLKTWRNPIVY